MRACVHESAGFDFHSQAQQAHPSKKLHGGGLQNGVDLHTSQVSCIYTEGWRGSAAVGRNLHKQQSRCGCTKRSFNDQSAPSCSINNSILLKLHQPATFTCPWWAGCELQGQVSHSVLSKSKYAKSLLLRFFIAPWPCNYSNKTTLQFRCSAGGGNFWGSAESASIRRWIWCWTPWFCTFCCWIFTAWVAAAERQTFRATTTVAATQLSCWTFVSKGGWRCRDAVLRLTQRSVQTYTCGFCSFHFHTQHSAAKRTIRCFFI